MKKTFFIILLFILILSTAFSEESLSNDIFHFSLCLSLGFGPEAGYLSILGIPEIQLGFSFFDILAIYAFENYINSMGAFGSWGAGVRIKIYFFGIDVSYSNAYIGINNIKTNSYSSINCNAVFYIPFRYFGKTNTFFMVEFGPSFLFDVYDINHANRIFLPLNSIFWNVKVGFQFSVPIR